MLPVSYSFENLKQNSPYNIIYLTNSEDVMEWASGNPGFQLTGMGFTPDDYPTAQIVDGYSGRGVRLQTRDTGSFGEMVDMRIAAGNLFVGSFDVRNDIRSPLTSTNCGFTLHHEPAPLAGWYPYHSVGEMDMAS